MMASIRENRIDLFEAAPLYVQWFFVKIRARAALGYAQEIE